MKKILMIQGSTRKESFNRQIQNAIVEELGDAVEVKELNYDDLPWMNQDLEFPVLESVQRVRDEFAAADGIWIVSPQYNGSYPGRVKNLLDWMSRPVAKGSSERVAKGKKVTVTGIGGRSQTKLMREKIAQVFSIVGMEPLDELGEGFTVNSSAWGDNVVILTDEQKAAIKAQVEAFLKFIEA